MLVLVLNASRCRKARDTIHKNRFLRKVAVASMAKAAGAPSPVTQSPYVIPKVTYNCNNAEEGNSSSSPPQCSSEPEPANGNGNGKSNINTKCNAQEGVLPVLRHSARNTLSALPACTSGAASESLVESSPARPSGLESSVHNSLTPPMTPTATEVEVEAEAEAEAEVEVEASDANRTGTGMGIGTGTSSRRPRCLTFSEMPARVSSNCLLQPKLSLNGGENTKTKAVTNSSCSTYELNELSQCSSTFSLEQQRSTAGPPSVTGTGVGGTTGSDVRGGSGGEGNGGGSRQRKRSRGLPLPLALARLRLRIGTVDRSESTLSPTSSERGARRTRSDLRRRIEQQREAKARRTLLIITLSFCR